MPTPTHEDPLDPINPPETAAEPASGAAPRRWGRWFAGLGCLALMAGTVVAAVVAMVGGGAAVAVGGGALAFVLSTPGLQDSGAVEAAIAVEAGVLEAEPALVDAELATVDAEPTRRVSKPATVDAFEAPTKEDDFFAKDDDSDFFAKDAGNPGFGDPEGDDDGLGDIVMLDDAPAPRRGKARASSSGPSKQKVSVTGDAAVRLLPDGGGSPVSLPGKALPGRYRIEARFPGEAAFEVGAITVGTSDATISCNTRMGICRVQ